MSQDLNINGGHFNKWALKNDFQELLDDINPLKMIWFSFNTYFP